MSADPPATPEQCIARGDELHDTGDRCGALKAYDRATALSPVDVEAWTSRGAVLSELGRWAEAALSYSRAIGIEPGDTELSALRGHAVAQMAAYAAAAYTPGVSTLTGGACAPPSAAAVEHAAVAAPALRDRLYAVVDGFLGETSAVRSWLQALKADGKLTRGETAAGEHAAARDELTFALSALPEDELPSAPRAVLQKVDELVCALQHSPELSGALAPSLLREEAQATCYPAGSTGYGRHVDEPDGSRGRVLSARVFVGDGWEAARGGETRLHLAGDAADVAPLDGRLLLFWSGRVPHEVRPCSTADRCALSVWYTDAAAAGAVAAGEQAERQPSGGE